jgi:hypothetical protein
MSAHHISFIVSVPQTAESDKNKKLSNDANGKKPIADKKAKKPVEDKKQGAGKKGNK